LGVFSLFFFFSRVPIKRQLDHGSLLSVIHVDSTDSTKNLMDSYSVHPQPKKESTVTHPSFDAGPRPPRQIQKNFSLLAVFPNISKILKEKEESTWRAPKRT
jgi:hypothetical protein